jgi:hypothetical protein
MNKFVAVLITLFLTTSALADGHRFKTPVPSHRHHHHHHHHHQPHSDWIAPVIIGGVIGYALSQQNAPQAQPTLPTCPAGTYPIYEKIWIQDANGTLNPADRFLGCR